MNKTPPPIAEPDEPPASPSPGKVWNRNFHPPWSRYYLAWFAIYMTAFVLTDPHLTLKSLWNTTILSAFCAAPCSLGWLSLKGIQLNETGIRAPLFVIWRIQLEWDEIRSVSKFHIVPGFPHLMVRGRKWRRIWLPLFLTHMDWFRATLREVAPETNPLRTWFDEREG